MNGLRKLIRVVGGLVMLLGILTLISAIALVVRSSTASARGSLGVLALAQFVSGMFFVLVGAGALLISRFRSRRTEVTEAEVSPRWTMPVVVLLFVCGAASIVLATVFAGMSEQFGEAAVGIVSYCMLIGVGLLFAGWGLKRARDSRELPPGQPPLP